MKQWEHPRVNKQVAGGRLGPRPRFLPEMSHQSQQQRRAAAHRRGRSDAATPGPITATGGASRTLNREVHSRFSRSSQRICEVTCMCTISTMLSKPTTKEPRFLITKRENISSRLSQRSREMLWVARRSQGPIHQWSRLSDESTTRARSTTTTSC